MSNVAIASRPRDSIDQTLSDLDVSFLRPAHALILRAPPFRWVFYRAFVTMYQDRIRMDLRALNDLRANEYVPQPVVNRVKGAIYTVAACSSWYAVSYSIFQGGFNLAIAAAAAGIIAAALLPPHTPFDSGSIAAIASAMLAVGLYVLLGLTGKRGWKFDFAFSIGVSALLWFAYGRIDFTGGQTAGIAASPYARKAVQEILVGGALYSAMIAVTALLGGLLYVWTTSLKKCQPEEEIIQTLLHVSDYLRRNRSRGNAWAVRRYVARQMDWIADRFVYDFLRPYRTTDAQSAAWQAHTALRLGAGVRAIKNSIILPDADLGERLQTRLVSALRVAAYGRWAGFPQADCAASTVSKRDTIAAAVRGIASLAMPLAVAVFAVWKLDDPLRSSIATACGSLALVNVLALVNPGGFDKQIDAAKSLTEVVRSKG